MTADLRALIKAVRPLEWSPVEEWMQCSKERAPAFGGEYQVVAFDQLDVHYCLYFSMGLGALQFRFELEEDPDYPRKRRPKRFATADEVKAAAQDDYATRALSALTDKAMSALRAKLGEEQP